MASGGSSGSPAPSSGRPFDFGSHDVLCSYDDFAAPDPSGGKGFESPVKEYQESRKGRPSINAYDQEKCSKEDAMSSVDKCMKKYADNVLHFLEGINSRLSQLEIHCYKLDRSIGEFRADIIRDHGDAEHRFKSLEKQIQEVHRSIQILRDKQELAETKNELTKLQLVHKESSRTNQQTKQSVSELNKTDDQSDTANKNLALALPHQGSDPGLSARAPEHIQLYKQVPLHRQAPIAPNVQHDRYIVNQVGAFYQNQILQPDLQYFQARPQDIPVHIQKQQLQTISQNQPTSFPQCQQQWTQQLPPQFPPQEVTASAVSSLLPMRPQMPYPSYPPQPPNTTPESSSVGTRVKVPYHVVPQPNNTQPEASFDYNGTGSSVSQPSPQHNIPRQTQPSTTYQSLVGLQPKGGYTCTPTYPPQYNIQGYNDAYSYQSGNLSVLQNQLPSHSSGLQHHGTQLIRSHPYGEMIERVTGVGYTREQVASVVDRMTESGQPIDFNALLDRLNGQVAGVPPRVW